MPSAENTIFIPVHHSPEVELDFTDNYWGTSEQDSIAAWIWDGVDNPSLGINVDYMPFRPEPTASVAGVETLTV